VPNIFKKLPNLGFMANYSLLLSLLFLWACQASPQLDFLITNAHAKD